MKYKMAATCGNEVLAYPENGADPVFSDDGDWVRYEDAEALQMRIIELEQQLKTQDELRAEFEKECE